MAFKGKKHSPQSKQKIAIALRNYNLEHPEAKAKRTKALQAYWEETKATEEAMRKAGIEIPKRTLSEEHKANISKAMRKHCHRPSEKCNQALAEKRANDKLDKELSHLIDWTERMFGATEERTE